MTGLHASTSNPQIGDLRATIRARDRTLNTIDHICAEAETTTGWIRADLIRAALGERQ